MVRYPTLIAAGFALFITTAAYAAPANEIAADLGQTLTLTSAKQMVADQLKASHQSQVRPGAAQFDADGNVRVDIVNINGLTVNHVLVHANGGQITAADVTKKRG